MNKIFRELVGTFFLVFLRRWHTVVTGGVPGLVAIVGIALAFGLGLIAAAYGIGPISGCHINPRKHGRMVAGRIENR